MALITKDGAWVQPQAYFGGTSSHIADLNIMSDTLAAMCETWSLLGAGLMATKIDPKAN